MDAGQRRLTRLERAAAYALLGWAAEVAFTALKDVIGRDTRSWRLRGHSYLWMAPIYGLAAVLFEPAHATMRGRPVAQRAAAYAGGITAVEYATGMAIRRGVGVVPWDYSGHGRFVVPGGAVRLDYLPLWACSGLVLERLDDTLRGLTIRTPAQARHAAGAG